MANILIPEDPMKIVNYGQEIITKATEFKQKISNIYDTVEMLKTNWKGAAAQKFVTNIDSFKEDYEKFGQVINDFGQLLTEIGQEYIYLENNL